MTAVSHDNRSGSAAISGINQHTSVARFLNNPFDRSRFRTDDRNDPVGSYNIAKANIDQFDIHTFTLSPLLDILDLFPDFFYLSFDLHNNLRQSIIVGFGSNGICLAVEFLDKKIELATDRLICINDQLELFNMAFQSDDLLSNTGTVSKNSDFLQQSFRFNDLVMFRKQFVDPVAQANLVFFNYLRRTFFDYCQFFGNQIGSLMKSP